MSSQQHLIYNTPDGAERDPEIIRGEAMVLSTPLSEKYSQAAYEALENIHDTCAADFRQMCAPQQPAVVSIDDLLQQFFNPAAADYYIDRRRLGSKQAKHFAAAKANDNKMISSSDLRQKLKDKKSSTWSLLRGRSTTAKSAHRSGAKLIDKFRGLYAGNAALSKVMYRPGSIIGQRDGNKTLLPSSAVTAKTKTTTATTQKAGKVSSAPRSFVMRSSSPVSTSTATASAGKQKQQQLQTGSRKQSVAPRSAMRSSNPRNLRIERQLAAPKAAASYATESPEADKYAIDTLPSSQQQQQQQDSSAPLTDAVAVDEMTEEDMEEALEDFVEDADSAADADVIPCGTTTSSSFSNSFFSPMMNLFPFSSLFSVESNEAMYLPANDAETAADEGTTGFSITWTTVPVSLLDQMMIDTMEDAMMRSEGVVVEEDIYYYDGDGYYDGAYYDDDFYSYYYDNEFEDTRDKKLNSKLQSQQQQQKKTKKMPRQREMIAASASAAASDRGVSMMRGASQRNKMSDFFPPPKIDHNDHHDYHSKDFHGHDHHDEHHDHDWHHDQDHHDHDHDKHHEEKHHDWHHGSPPPPPLPTDARDPSQYRDATAAYKSFIDDGDDDVEESSSSSSSSSSFSSDSSSSESGDRWGPRDHHDRHHGGPPPPPPHHHRPLPPDTRFAGNLGFGAEADICMYQNFPQLSNNCQDSVAELYSVREDYWKEYNESQDGPPPHPCFIGILLIVAVAVLAIGCVKRLCMHKRRKQMKGFLDALRANPKLKAQVEQQTGFTVPPPPAPCCFSKLAAATHCTNNNSQQQQAPAAGSCRGFLCRFAKALLFLSVVFVSSLFISISSLELTAAIVDYLDMNAPVEDDGSVHPVSPIFALVILFSICSVQLFLLGLVVRSLKMCVLRHKKKQQRQQLQQPVQATVSAVPVQEASLPRSNGGFNGSSGDGNGSNGGVFSTAWNHVMLMPRSLQPVMSSMFHRSTAGSYQPLNGYEAHEGEDSQGENHMVLLPTPTAPLLSQQEHANTEMVSFSAHPQQQRQVAMLVSAAPMTNISMV